MFYIIAFIFWASCVFEFGALYGTIIFLVLYAIATFFYQNYLKEKERLLYHNLVEDILVVSSCPYGNLDFEISHGQNEAVVLFVRRDLVVETARQEERKLSEYDNRLFLDKNLHNDIRLKVHYFIYQSDKYVNENWLSFQKRVIDQVQKNREIKHQKLATYDLVWYQKYMLYQERLNWSKK